MGQSQKLNIQPRSRSPLVHLAGIRKSFDGKTVIDNLNLTINNGEFLTLLGPSGCGKTTVLRLIAGLETVDSGRIMLDNEDITHVPAENRYVNTVFQSYALFPHMTVFENVAFGLRMQKTPAAEITPRVMEALRMVQLETFAQRKPHQLSGGQQQRVAIARAVVNKPRLLLLDESLSALDYKLRKQMQNELKALQRKLGITFVFVTHDQEEAVELADKIVVTNKGRVEQIGTPQEIYGEPQTPFVAGFMGKPDLLADYGQLKGFTQRPGMTWAVIRPEFVKVFKYGDADDDKSAAEDGIVEAISFYGTYLTMKIRIGTLTIQAEQSIETNTFKVGEKVQVLIYRLFICDENTVEIAKNKALEAGQVFYI